VPGQYIVSLFGADPSARPLTRLPLLLTTGKGVTWDLPVSPPDGLVLVPPGPFLLGPDGQVAETEILFFAMRTEVSIRLFRQFLAAAAERGPGAFQSPEERRRFGEQALPLVDALTFEGLDELLPVHRVHFYEAMSFAKWYTETFGEGRIEYRLPTRLEWVKLALGTDGRVHPWGNQVLPPVHRATDTRGLVAVDSFPDRASPYGALHMEGNVAEWTLEEVRGDGTRRLVLGRSLDADSDLWRAAVGLGEEARRRSPGVGFRLVGVPR
jgi:formylglycine-generating enzyme required for sulfatase activity